MAWYDFILDTGKQFFKPQNLMSSLGTAGIMQLFGGDSDDFKRNFLLSNLSDCEISEETRKQCFDSLVIIELFIRLDYKIINFIYFCFCFLSVFLYILNSLQQLFFLFKMTIDLRNINIFTIF